MTKIPSNSRIPGRNNNIVNRHQAFRQIVQSKPTVRNPRSQKSATGAPQFPGSNSGMSIEQVRNFIAQQPRTTGVSFSVAAASSSIVSNIQLPGDAKILLGIMFTPTTATDDTFSLSVNNVKFIAGASILLHSSENSQCIQDGFFPYYQPLSGTDTFELTVISVAGLNGVIEFKYI